MKKSTLAIFLISIIIVALSYSITYVSAETATISLTQNMQQVITDNTFKAYLSADSNDAVSWEIEDTAIATIQSSNSRSAVVKGVKQGSTVLEVFDAEGNMATCAIDVSNPELSIKNSLRIQLEKTEYLYLDKGVASQWLSSNPDIVTIEYSYSSYARIHAVGLGKATISATDKYGTKVECEVTVKEWPELDVSLTGYEGNSYDSADFSYYREWYTEETDGWWDDDWNWHDTIDNYYTIDGYYIHANNALDKVYSQNTKVVKVTFNESTYRIEPVGVGKTNVIVLDEHGESVSVTCKVTLGYMLERYEYVYSYDDNYRAEYYSPAEYHYYNVKYGSGLAKGKTYKKATVTVCINGKNFSGKANGSGYYNVKIPTYLKLGTKLSISSSRYGYTYKCERKVITNNPGLSVGKIRRNSTKVKVTVKNVHKGDTIRVKVGSKVFKKKIKKNKKKYACTIKIKKPKRIKKVNVSVYNKFNQALKSKNIKVRK